ncbi:MAG: ABC transporter ATP-binding protein [Desulfobacterales bacterium]|nr:MAG: ABC transporter ATP-binding protein [Desulfobacterales bacterium]
MIQTKNLTKIFTAEEVETTALNNVNVEIQDGEFVAIMGPSGCGKSTFLHIAGMLDKPSDGEYYFMNEEVSNYSEKKRANLRKGNIGFVFQSFNLIDELTVFENIELPLLYLGVSASDRKKQVNDTLEQLELMPRKNHFPQQISGGQQQRVAVARAVIANPKVILADEPTGNLDSSHGEEVMKILVDLNERGITIVMVTHSPAYADYANRVVHLFDGHIVSENLKAKYDRHMQLLSEVTS